MGGGVTATNQPHVPTPDVSTEAVKTAAASSSCILCVCVCVCVSKRNSMAATAISHVVALSTHHPPLPPMHPHREFHCENANVNRRGAGSEPQLEIPSHPLTCVLLSLSFSLFAFTFPARVLPKMDPTNPSATASGAAVLPTCSTISSASTHQQQMQPYGAFGGVVGTGSGHASTGSGPGGGGGGGGGGGDNATNLLSPTLLSPGTNTGTASIATSRDEEDDSSNQASSGSKGSGQRRVSLRASPEAHTSLVSRTGSEDVWQPGGYQTMWQQQPPTLQQHQRGGGDSGGGGGGGGGGGSSSGRQRGRTAHYQSIDRSQSFNGSDRMSRWYQYHQQRHPLSRTGSHRHSQLSARRFSLRDVEDDDYDDDDDDDAAGSGGRGSGVGDGSSSILNRMVSYDSVTERGSSCGGLLTHHRVSHPSVASSSLDGRFATSLGSLSSQQPPQTLLHGQQQQQQLHHQQLHEQQLSKSISNGTTRGAQSWKNLRAVMAYYCSLRKIKRTKSNQRWMKLRTTVQISSAISQKKPPLKREDSFLKRFSTRQIPEAQETVEDTGSEGATDAEKTVRRRRRFAKIPRTVVNPDENFYFYWLMLVTISILYNLWTLIVRQSFPELQSNANRFWISCDCLTDIVFIFDVAVQLRTGYLEQGLMVYDSKKLAGHYLRSRAFLLDLAALIPLDILQLRLGSQPMLRFPRFFKVYRAVKYYYIVESRTVWPNLWRVVNLIHILLILAHWFGCFYFLLSEAEGFQGDWVYPYRPGDYATLTRKYLGSLYWSTLTLTTIGDLPTPETNAEPSQSADGPRSLPRRGLKSRLLQFNSSRGYVFTIVSYLIGVFIFATIVGQVGNVITNRNANRLEFERLLDGAKTYMRHHKVPGGMKRRVLRWYDYSWSRGRIQGGGDINTALGLLPDKLKTELALHVNLSVLKKVTIFQECQPEFLHDLVLKMKAYIFTPGDSICRKGEVAREMFIIADGILEVLSETGKVLTTMKAGDFFGEIGILNLDGLNKRTADVRSVGYSELFSLSREDVLTAMKDYPEAQEILQTLGRKRLMEVRCVNKKHASKHAAKEHAAERSSNTHNNQGDSSDNSASKRIVDKLRCDVKGLKNVLRKSRTGTTRRSNESIEMQPLHGHATGAPSGSGGGGGGSGGSTGSGSKTPKTMLKRMPRVKSDDIHTEDEGKDNDKVPSPIGAGLPLLQRLRMLKEKQLQVTSNQTSSSPSIVQSMSPTSPTVKGPPSPILNTAGTASHHLKPTMRVSFRDRIRNLHHQDSKHHGEAKVTVERPGTILETTDMKQHLLQSSTPSHGKSTLHPHHGPHHHHGKGSSGLSLKEKIRSLGQLQRDDQLKPWSKLKLATVVSLGGSYTSLNNAASEESPILKQSKRNRLKTSIPADLNLNSLVSMTPPPISSAPPITCAAPQTTFQVPNAKSSNFSYGPGEKVSVSDSEVASAGQPSAAAVSRGAAGNGRHHSGSGATMPGLPARVRMKPKPIKLDSEQPKAYMSIDDLSPEYCGLPFVKKLKILNERQKLAELESAISKTRSLSLDCTDSNTSNTSSHDLLEQLTRSQSEGSGMASQGATTTRSKADSPPVDGTATATERLLLLPLSPESNETLERRQLKSILKKLSEDKAALEQRPTRDLKKLMRAQTVEGYVARHSKFTKSVTFHRNTLSSPPSSASLLLPRDSIEDPSLFPLLSAQTVTAVATGGGTVLLPPATELDKTPSSTSTTSVATASTTNTTTSTTTTSSTTTIEREHELLRSSYYQVLEEHHEHRLAPVDEPPAMAVDGQALAVISNGDPLRGYPHDAEPDLELEQEDGVMVPDDPSRTSLSALAGQRKLIRGSLEEQEFFGEVLFGIKQVIQTHMKEIQVKFQDEFFNLELEVKKRDDIISKLQNRILELEGEQQQEYGRLQVQLPPEHHQSGSSGSGSTGSSNELPFMRGDSLDTIFASSPHSDSDAPRQPKVRSRKPRTSPRHRQLRNRPTWDESTDQESFDRKDSPPLGPPTSRPMAAATNTGPPPPVPPRRPSTVTAMAAAVAPTTTPPTNDQQHVQRTARSPYRDLVISELTGNIISDSVIVNIETTSSSQSEAEHEEERTPGQNIEEEEEEEDDGDEMRRLMRRSRSRSRETEDGRDGDEEEEEDDEEAVEEEEEGQDNGEELEEEQADEEEEEAEEEEGDEEQEAEEEEEEEEDEEELNHNDWEVRMLAAELKKRESISTDFPSELEPSEGHAALRRRHRKRSDTDTDGSDAASEARDIFGRPRASSLDQHNLQRRGNGSSSSSTGTATAASGHGATMANRSSFRSRGGIFKALSFDRDKDRL
ncbi:uncharacterized protein LOC118461631 isoform X7 [Anopheles albimanus]|uniref:uncharacterized protein LOC118461631 isoform X7 n=1 Tax=Anopheles albimanus TaxID=7167 RepID=UPI0016418DA4|nr:uncharacterized protein LOC118461631 isoform X7 [Anopheles albimanus]